MIATLGRLPEADEYRPATEIAARFGSLNRAFSLIKRVTGASEWEAITRRCAEDLLVYLALGRFRRRPPILVLPLGLQRDIRAFFGSYANGCRRADELLFQAGDADAVDDACRRSAVGKLLPGALYVHRTALDALDPLLRVFEGCAHVPGGDRGGEPDQTAPPVGQGLVPGLPRVRDQPPPGAGAKCQAGAPDPPDRLSGVRQQPQPADPPPPQRIKAQNSAARSKASSSIGTQPKRPRRASSRPSFAVARRRINSRRTS